MRVVTPAPLADVVALYTSAEGTIKPLEFKAALLQAARSDTIGFIAGGDMIAAAILYPCEPETPGEELRELAFACRPAAAGHLTAIIHAARLTRAALAETGAVRVRARVRMGHRPGQRLARLCRLRLVGTEGAFEVYEWASTDGQLRQGHQGPVHRAGHIGQ